MPAATAIPAPTVLSEQSVTVPSVAARAAILAPDRVDQTISVPAVPAAAAVLALARVDQTLDIGATGAAVAIPAPTVLAAGDQFVTVPAVAAATAIPAPTFLLLSSGYALAASRIRSRWTSQFPATLTVHDDADPEKTKHCVDDVRR